MSYCLNPDCPKPHNPDEHNFCQGCGWGLLLKQRYRPIQLIAQGGFGRTFFAVDEGQLPPLLCVLKQLLTRNQTVEVIQKTKALFQQEILLLEDLGKHPQIPTLLAHFEDNQQLYLVQEFIDGSNLAQLVDEEGTFSEAEIWQLLDDILPVLKFVHDHQVIHRDLKPENIIRRALPYQGALGQSQEQIFGFHPYQGRLGGTQEQLKKGQFVLVDFGAAKLVTGREFLQKGTCIGSPEYVAPEQLKGKAVFASDLYSLGVTCIYLLTGTAPFDLFDVVNDCWVWQDYLTEKISDNLIAILDKLLAYTLTQRFASVDEVMQAINHRQNKVRVKVDAIPPPTMSWKCRTTFEGNNPINSVAISPDASLLASGSEDKNACLWNLDTGKVIARLTGHSQGVKSVAFSPDDAILATSSDDRTIKLWNISNHQEICTLSTHSHAVKSVAFSPDGTILASGSWDKTIRLWNVKTGLLESTLTGHILQVTSIAFSPCGQFLASASCDRTMRLWDLSSGLSTIFRGHAWAVLAVAFSPDGNTLATGSDDNTVILWNLKTGKALYTFSGHSWSVVSLAYTPDSKILVSGSWDKMIKLWQISTGKEIATLQGHLDSVYAVAVSSDGQIIVSASKDQTLKLWRRDE